MQGELAVAKIHALRRQRETERQQGILAWGRDHLQPHTPPYLLIMEPSKKYSWFMASVLSLHVAHEPLLLQVYRAQMGYWCRDCPTCQALLQQRASN
jgi:hypothetical protein